MTRRILVVDDSRDVAELMREVLQLEGFEADAVFDGAAALARCVPGAWHAVLMDLNLPGCSGVSLAAQWRERLSPAPWLVALSGAAKAELQAAVHPGAFDHAFQKPVDLAALLMWLRRMPVARPSH